VCWVRGQGEGGTRCQNTALDANCLTEIMCRRLLCIHSKEQTFSVHEVAGNSLLVSGPAARLKDCEVLTYPGLSCQQSIAERSLSFEF